MSAGQRGGFWGRGDLFLREGMSSETYTLCSVLREAAGRSPERTWPPRARGCPGLWRGRRRTRSRSRTRSCGRSALQTRRGAGRGSPTVGTVGRRRDSHPNRPQTRAHGSCFILPSSKLREPVKVQTSRFTAAWGVGRDSSVSRMVFLKQIRRCCSLETRQP